MNNKTLEFIQKQLEYEFHEPNLLRQAFTRKSYSEEHNGAYHNEVLEFYGDKALEFTVMKKLSEYFGETKQNGKYASQKTEGQLTELKKKLVCKKMLAHRIDVLNFADCLLMGKGDETQNTQNQESVKEDLFEAIIGAVAIDCGWNAETLEEVVDRMIDIEYYLENGFQNDENYVDLIQTWCQKKYGTVPCFRYEERGIAQVNDLICFPRIISTEGERGRLACTMTLGNSEILFRGYGESKKEARKNACRRACEHLDEENKWILPIDEVGEPDIDRAINQLQELYQKGRIDQPSYEFSETYDKNGNPVWYCECSVGRKSWHGYHSSKKQGKKSVAYSMLCDILGWEEDDET